MMATTKTCRAYFLASRRVELHADRYQVVRQPMPSQVLALHSSPVGRQIHRLFMMEMRKMATSTFQLTKLQSLRELHIQHIFDPDIDSSSAPASRANFRPFKLPSSLQSFACVLLTSEDSGQVAECDRSATTVDLHRNQPLAVFALIFAASRSLHHAQLVQRTAQHVGTRFHAVAQVACIMKHTSTRSVSDRSHGCASGSVESTVESHRSQGARSARQLRSTPVLWPCDGARCT
jgi:hypothetical protein